MAISSLYPSHRQRFGVGVTSRWGYGLEDFSLELIRPSWYVDWSWKVNPLRPLGMEYGQTIRVQAGVYPPNWDTLAQAVAQNPGSLWILGNEPDTRHQDERSPAEYAQIYHDLYVFIKSRDLSAQIAPAGIVQPTPLRLRWWDMVWDAFRTRYGYTMPVDVWNIHVQILREDRHDWGCGIPTGITDVDRGEMYDVVDNANPAIFREHIWRFRRWMKEKGQQNKPLIITEMGVVMPCEYLPEGEATITRFMREVFHFLLSTTDPALGCPADGYRLVQRWAWYSLNEKPFDFESADGYNGALFVWNEDRLTAFGQVYREFTMDEGPSTGAVVPSDGVGSPGITYFFTATYSDPDGFSDIADVYLLMNDSPTESGGVLVRYQQAERRLYLRRLDGSGWMPDGGYIIGNSNQIAHGLATLDVGLCQAIANGNSLTVTYALRFGEAMNNRLWSLYLKAEDRYGVFDGWNAVGTFRLGAQPTPTPTLEGKATLQGSIALQGRPLPPHHAWRTPLRLVLYAGSLPVYAFDLSSDDFGQFRVLDLTPGVYNLRIKGAHTLSNEIRDVFLQAGLNQVYLGLLREGDANQDDVVDITDFSILRSVFATSDARADFNQDGVVDITDFSLLRSNFARAGPIAVSGLAGK